MLLLLRVCMCAKVLDKYLRQYSGSKWLEYFGFEHGLDLFVGHSSCLVQELFGELLVYVPDVSALEL